MIGDDTTVRNRDVHGESHGRKPEQLGDTATNHPRIPVRGLTAGEDKVDVHAALASIVHRGPDGHGVARGEGWILGQRPDQT